MPVDNKEILEIYEIADNKQLQSIRELFIEYADSLGVDLAFQGFEEELNSLPGKYSAPDGCILIAEFKGYPAGSVALRKISHEICEMKRLYVRNDFRGMGIGKLLANRIITKARELGYSHMRLDTLPTMIAAQVMYKELGFYEIESYVYNPIEGTKFLEIEL
jgi:ribosomal protein S18 acetylase RimI-like enzyme